MHQNIVTNRINICKGRRGRKLKNKKIKKFKNMKNKTIIYIIALAGIGFLSANMALAHNLSFGWGMGNISADELAAHHQQMFVHQARILGISVEEVKNAWAEGKTIGQLIQEKKLDLNKILERAKELRLELIKNHLQTLVSKGIISQEQADKRLQFMQNKQNIGLKMGFGMKMKRGFWGF